MLKRSALHWGCKEIFHSSGLLCTPRNKDIWWHRWWHRLTLDPQNATRLIMAKNDPSLNLNWSWIDWVQLWIQSDNAIWHYWYAWHFSRTKFQAANQQCCYQENQMQTQPRGSLCSQLVSYYDCCIFRHAEIWHHLYNICSKWCY